MSIGEPEEGFLVRAHPGVLRERRKLETFFVCGELRWNLVENRHDFVLVAAGKPSDVLSIEIKNLSLLKIGFCKGMSLRKNIDDMRHTSHEHVFTYEAHCLFMQGIRQRPQRSVGVSENVDKRLLVDGAEKFLEVERMQTQAFFFRRNQDAVNVLLDRKQRSGFDAVKTRIGRNVLDEGACKWKVLDIAEKQQ